MKKTAFGLFLAGVILFGLLVALGLGAFRDFVDEVQAIVTWSTSGFVVLIMWALATWMAAPNFVKQQIARLIRLLPDVPNHFKKRAIKNEIESSINKAFEQFNREGAGFIEHEISISWLDPGDVKDVFFQSGKAYLKLDYTENVERNLVEAALLFCRRGLLPETRQYVSRPLMQAIDLQFVNEILRQQKVAEGRAYFVHEVMYRELKDSQETQRFVERLQIVSQHGLFTRVLLPELRDYPALALEVWPDARHAKEIESYLDFVEATVKSREEGTKTALVHVGQAIRTAIVLVGMPSRLQFEGTRPYVRRVAMNEQEGAHTVYLLGYNQGLGYIEAIAKEASLRGLVSGYEMELYDAAVRDRVERHKIARLDMRSGEGSRFVVEHPMSSDWPDIQDDVEWRQILEQVVASNADYQSDPTEET